MKLFSILAAAITVTASLACAQTIRVGTFHKQSVVVAFYRSPLWADAAKAKVAELAAARKASSRAMPLSPTSWKPYPPDFPRSPAAPS